MTKVRKSAPIRISKFELSSVFDIRHSTFRERGFTIIELLVVIAIITVLAGLILSTVGYVQKKGARSRAEAEIAAMSAALESYKADNGIYPKNTDTDSLDSTTDTNPSDYSSASKYLYVELTGDRDFNGTADSGAKSYMSFKNISLLRGNMSAEPSGSNPVTAMRDPFGNAYGYSTMKASDSTKHGFNPTFDLWSTANSIDPNQWIKNW